MRLNDLQIGLLGLGALVLLGGCSTSAVRPPEYRRSAGLAAGHQGAAWESVLPGPAVTAALGPGAGWRGPEFDRRDAALSHRPERAQTALDEWPQAEQPDLWRARRLTLPRDAGSVIFFERDSRSNHDRSGPRHPYEYNRYRSGEHW